MAMRLVVDIALAHIRSRTRQTIISLFGVATGVGFTIAMAALMQGSQEDFVRKMIDAMPHITISDEFRRPPLQPIERLNPGGAVALRGVKPKEELRGIRNVHARIARLRDLPGVAVGPTLRGQIVIRYGGRDVSAALVGTEPETERNVSKLADDLREGSLDGLRRTANALIIGSGIAEKLGARMGSSLTVSSPVGLTRRMKVVGIFHTGVTGFDNGQAYTLLKTAQVLQDRPNVINEIRLRLDDVNQARDIAHRIEAFVGYRSESWEEANESILEVFFIRNIIMFTVVGAILIVAGFGIFNIISTITYEKARDIAILKSLGFRERDIRAIFLYEGLLMGFGGSVLGWGLGYGLSTVLASIPFEVEAFTEITSLPILYSPLHYAAAGAAAMIAAAIAGYLPARRAARLNPVDIIRGAT